MKVKVKVDFHDTEFGLFESGFDVQGKNGLSYRGAYLEFTANGIPRRQFVLEEDISGREYRDALDENPVYASLIDGVYWIIERTLRSEGYDDIEIEYEGEDEMEEKTITVPGGTNKVTLNIEQKSERPEGITLRQALMATPSSRNVVVVVRERPSINGKRVGWEMFLPAVSAMADEMSNRRAKVSKFAECQLCDVGVLLDERPVKAIDIRFNSREAMYCAVFEVENDA